MIKLISFLKKKIVQMKCTLLKYSLCAIKLTTKTVLRNKYKRNKLVKSKNKGKVHYLLDRPLKCTMTNIYNFSLNNFRTFMVAKKRVKIWECLLKCPTKAKVKCHIKPDSLLHHRLLLKINKCIIRIRENLISTKPIHIIKNFQIVIKRIINK